MFNKKFKYNQSNENFTTNHEFQEVPNTSITADITQLGELSTNNNIIQNNYNGRVDIMDTKSEPQFPLFQQNNTGTNIYNDEALKGVLGKSPLSCLFFSKENINIIQNLLRRNVYLQSGKKHIIGRQSDLQLEIIMRSIYLQYSRNLPYSLNEQVKKLNNMVLDYSIPHILSEIQQYLAYKQNVSTLPKQIPRPKSLSSAGTKTLVLNNFFPPPPPPSMDPSWTGVE